MRLGQSSLVAFAAQFLGSIIGFLAIVFISRELGAAVLGMYFLALAVQNWVRMFSTAGVVTSVTKRMSAAEGDGARYLSAGVVIQGTITVIALGLMLLFRGRIDSFVGEPVTPLLIVIVGLGSLYSLVKAGLMGQQRVHVSSLLDPVDQTFGGAAQVLLVVLGLGLIGALTGKIIGLLVVVTLGAVLLNVQFVRPGRVDLERILSFARYAWIQGIQSKTYIYLDTVVIGAFAASQFVGFYQVSFNIAAILALFGVSVIRTLFPALSTADSADDPELAASLFSDGIAFSGLLLVPGIVGSVLIGADVLRIYGSEFTVARWILVLLVVSQLFYVYMMQTVTMLNALDRPGLAFRVNAVFIVTNLLLNVWLVPTVGYEGAAVASGLTALLGFALGYRLVASSVPVSLPVGEVARQVVAALVMGVAVGGMLQVRTPATLPGPPTIGTVFYALVGAAVYGVTLYGLSARVRTVVHENLPVAPDRI
jgi:O-antigen/teichoic acid export membrane protein